MAKNINTGASVGQRTSEALYSGEYVSPAFADGLNKTFKTRELIVEFHPNGSGGFVMPILSLGVAANEKSCKGTCGVNNGCCKGYLEGLGATAFERTGGVAAGSLTITSNYDQTYFTSGISKMAFFVSAPSVYGHQIIATLVSSIPGRIVYKLEGYNATGVLSDEPFIGATINMTSFINDPYTA